MSVCYAKKMGTENQEISAPEDGRKAYALYVCLGHYKRLKEMRLFFCLFVCLFVKTKNVRNYYYFTAESSKFNTAYTISLAFYTFLSSAALGKHYYL